MSSSTHDRTFLLYFKVEPSVGLIFSIECMTLWENDIITKIEVKSIGAWSTHHRVMIVKYRSVVHSSSCDDCKVSERGPLIIVWWLWSIGAWSTHHRVMIVRSDTLQSSHDDEWTTLRYFTIITRWWVDHAPILHNHHTMVSGSRSDTSQSS
jgi:hypothetical protein